MLQLLHAGIVASRRQFMVVLALTAVFFVVELSGANRPLSRLFLTWSYVLVAVGMALTSGKAIDLTVAQLRRTNRRLTSKPTLRLAAAHCGLAAVLLSILVLQSPPATILTIAELCGLGSVASIVWPGLMSLGVAGFGAMAYASVKAIEGNAQ